MSQIAVLALLLNAACFMRLATPPPPQPLSRQEAIEIATHSAEERGYRVRTVEELERDGFAWTVNLRVAQPLRGSVRVLVDLWTGSILRFDERLKRRRHEHEDEEHEHRHHEDDD